MQSKHKYLIVLNSHTLNGIDNASDHPWSTITIIYANKMLE